MGQEAIQKSQQVRRVNTSGLHPLGHAVLVEPYEPERKKGLIEVPANLKAKTAMLECRAVVIEVGPAAWEEESFHRAGPGDKVMIAAFEGEMIVGVKDGKQYRMVRDNSIYCRIDDEEKEDG